MDPSDYLDRQYYIDRSMVKEVQAQADHALKTLEKTYLGSGGWPYSAVNRKALAAKKSHSTPAMILHAVAVAYGVISESVLVPAIKTGTGKQRDPREVMPLIKSGTSALLQSLNVDDDKQPMTTSGTWGSDDPLTLTWLYEVLKTNVVDDPQAERARQRIKTLAEQRVDALIDDPDSPILNLGTGGEGQVRHPFALLRSVQLASAVGAKRWSELRLSKVPKVFLDQLHTELSNNAIRDGGFDPACLVFALEGLLILNSEAVTDAVLEQVVKVLADAPIVGTHWRPVRPLFAKDRGFVLLPQSVRSCEFVSARV